MGRPAGSLQVVVGVGEGRLGTNHMPSLHPRPRLAPLQPSQDTGQPPPPQASAPGRWLPRPVGEPAGIKGLWWIPALLVSYPLCASVSTSVKWRSVMLSTRWAVVRINPVSYVKNLRHWMVIQYF